MGDYIVYTDLETFLGTTFTVSQQNQVNQLISFVEDYIEKRTGRAWRDVTVTEIHSVDKDYRWAKGRPIALNHRPIKTGSLVVERWSGSDWQNWSQNAGYEVDDSLGMVYLRGAYMDLMETRMRYRITYTYNEGTVPADIKQACIFLVAYHIIINESKYFIIPEGADKITLRERAEMWLKQVEDIIRYNEEPISGNF